MRIQDYSNLIMEQLAERVNANERLVWRGRYVDTAFLLEVGDGAWLIKIASGRIDAVTPVTRVMPSWSFALRASREVWTQFWQPVPQPGFHDLMAMVKRRHFKNSSAFTVFPFCVFEIRPLNDNRSRLHKKHTAERRQ